MKVSSAVRAEDASPGRGEHVLVCEVSVSYDETTVRVNNNNPGAPAVE